MPDKCPLCKVGVLIIQKWTEDCDRRHCSNPDCGYVDYPKKSSKDNYEKPW